MTLTPYKQTLSHSCLAACFLIVRGRYFTATEEQDLAIRGSHRTYPYYIVGIPWEFLKQFNFKVAIYVDNKFFASILQQIFSKEKRVSIIHKKITISHITELLHKQPLICHIDDHALGDYSHASHFIVLEKATETFISIIDPWSGLRRRISNATLEKAIRDLKTQIKMCPLLFTLEA